MKKLTCIICPNSCSLTVDKDESGEFIVTGNSCNRGRDFAISEVTRPVRSVCSTVKTTFKEMPRLSVRTSEEVPLDRVFDVMHEISQVVIDKPVHEGDKILCNVLGLEADIIATSDMYIALNKPC